MVAPAAGIAMMNSRSSPRRSAVPRSRASRSSLRAALNTIDRVVMVTVLAASAGSFDGQGRQGLAFAVPLVGDEPVHVLAAQRGGIMTAAWRLQFQEDAQLDSRPPEPVDRAGGARASR